MVAKYINEHGIFAESHRQKIDGSVYCYLEEKETCPSDTFAP